MIAQFSEAYLTEWRRPFDFPPAKCELRSDHLHQSLQLKVKVLVFRLTLLCCN